MQIHYGEINFPKVPLGETTQEQGPRQDTEYAEVHLSSKDAPPLDRKGPEIEELYAKVQKKQRQL